MKSNLFRKIIVGVALIAGATSSPVFAENFYAGASVIQTYVDDFGLDDDTTGGKIYGGYRFNEYFAVEASYFDFGELENRVSSLEIDGFGISAVGSYPVTSKLEIFGKLGVQYWDADARGPIVQGLNDDSDTDAFYGIGVRYSITDSISIQAEAERYEIEDIDLDAASIGVSYKF